MSTPGWLSEYVEKISDFLVGTVVFRLMRAVKTPPAVSILQIELAHSRCQPKTNHSPSGERGNIEQKKVLGLLRSITREDGGLHGGTVRDSLVRVNATIRLLA